MQKIAAVIVMCLLMSACTSMVDHRELIRDGEYSLAEQAIIDSVEAKGKNRLLHHLERGMLAHLQGHYKKSNELFDQAEIISEELYTTSLSDLGLSTVTGTSFSTYKGLNFEKTLLGYYKILNYLKIAESKNTLSESDLDNALVEVRRLNNRLTELTTKTGGYQKKRKTDDPSMNKLLGFLSQALGERIDSEALAYKDDAFAHYLSGLLYEMSGDLDSARIEYEKSAKAYQNGFAENYKLGKQGLAQAWYDTARMMKMSGGYDEQLRQLSQKHLSIRQHRALKSVNNKTSELIVIQHLGFAPQKKELNMMLSVDKYSRALILTPIPVGTYQERQDQLNWFNMLYADNDLFNMIKNYATGDLGTVILGTVTKRIPLGPLWEQAVELDLIDALSTPSRISVSYYPSIKKKFLKSELYIDGKPQAALFPANSIARIALQEQLNVANSQIHLALAREITKAIIAEKAAARLGEWGAIASVGLNIINAITGGADTRHWTTLPGAIKFSRVTLPPGKHELVLKTTLTNGHIVKQKQEINTTKTRPKLWQIRTFTHLPPIEETKTPVPL
jgi:uncharacterized protein